MESRRFILVVSCVTVFFCVLTVIYNFAQQPPLSGIFPAAVSSGQSGSRQASSADFYSLFAGSSRTPGSSAGKTGSAVSPAVSAGVRSAPAAVSAARAVSRAVSGAVSSRQASSYATKQPPAAPVNLNTATLAQLETLPGIGPVLGQRILDYRDTHGAFASVDALDAVKGIGAKTLAKLRPYVKVS